MQYVRTISAWTYKHKISHVFRRVREVVGQLGVSREVMQSSFTQVKSES